MVRAEIALIIVVGLTVTLCLHPFRTTTPTLQRRCIEGATIVILVSAWQLGEVFFTMIWALAMACHAAQTDQSRHRRPGHSPRTVTSTPPAAADAASGQPPPRP